MVKADKHLHVHLDAHTLAFENIYASVNAIFLIYFKLLFIKVSNNDVALLFILVDSRFTFSFICYIYTIWLGTLSQFVLPLFVGIFYSDQNKMSTKTVYTNCIDHRLMIGNMAQIMWSSKKKKRANLNSVLFIMKWPL